MCVKTPGLYLLFPILQSAEHLLQGVEWPPLTLTWARSTLQTYVGVTTLPGCGFLSAVVIPTLHPFVDSAISTG